MPNGNVQAFMDALQRAEQTRDAKPVASMFAPDAEVHSYTRDNRGADAETFWRQYLAAFGAVRSTFTRVAEWQDEAALEWVSDGTLPDGSPIRYEGVSLLTFRGDKVARFRTYYDSGAFVPPAAIGH